MIKYIKILVITALAVSVGLVFSTVNQVYAEINVSPQYERNEVISDLVEKIEVKKDKIDTLKSSSAEYERKISLQRTQSVTLENELGIMDNLITKIELDIKTKQLQIDKTKLEIEATTYQIEKEEKVIEAQKAQLIEYLKLIYKNDQKTYLEILILNNSFSEFFSQVNYVEELQADIKKSVDRLKYLKEALEVKRAELTRKEEDLEALKKELEERQIKLKEEIKAKEILLFQSKNSEEEFQKLLVQTKQLQNEIDSDILNIEDEILRKIERLRIGSGTTNANATLLGWPVDPSRGITTYYRDPDYPYRHLFEHSAIDIRAYQGTNLKAPADGYVSRAKDNGYGYSYIIIIHDNGISTVYGHVSAIYVTEGEYVKFGDVIGLTGGMPGTLGAGRLTTGPHLHFEVRLNGIPVNPLEYLP